MACRRGIAGLATWLLVAAVGTTTGLQPSKWNYAADSFTAA